MFFSEKYKLSKQQKIMGAIIIMTLIIDIVFIFILDFHTEQIGGLSLNGQIIEGKYYVLDANSINVEISGFQWFLNAILFFLCVILSLAWGLGNIFFIFTSYFLPFFFPSFSLDFGRGSPKTKSWKCSYCSTKNSGHFSDCYKCKNERKV